jgi:alanyl aminopeptidase
MSYRVLLVIAFNLLGQMNAVAAIDPPFRLPSTVIPESYRLDLTILPDAAGFSGHAEIDILITEPVDEIWIHGRALDVKKVTVLTAAGESYSATFEQVTPDGMARIVPGQPLPPQRATLRFDYEASFGDSLRGLYKVTVGDDHYAFSQLESISARKVFPAFDEPVFKTPFEISVTTRREYRAFSNTQAVATKNVRRGLQRISYAPTQPLPTYLIAFAVGPLDVVDWRAVPPSIYREESLPLRGITVRGQGGKIGFALQNTASILLTLEDYFGTAYPYDKLDIVAVPDFGAGAMENAGLITYREPRILLDDPPAVDQVRRFAITHTHELAHQWFGNLVTMPWWDDIWLNEAFASWIQARIADAWDPQYQFDRETQVRAIHAMREDSLVSARQVREPVNSTADIKNAFDAITYAKGAGVLEMLENYVGEQDFQTGLREHMQRYAFGTASVYDLIDSLQRVAGDQFAIPAIVDSFLFQPGVPYLTVVKQCVERSGADASARILISQERYLPIGSDGDPNQVWNVPVCFVYGSSDDGVGTTATQCVLLSDRAQSFPIDDGRNCPEWMMPNADGTGYFRWRMEADEIESLSAVYPSALNDGERLSFVDSLIAGVSNGSFAAATLLNTLPMIADDPDWRVVVEPLRLYKQLYDEVIDSELKSGARDYAADLFIPRLADAIQRAEQSAEASALRNKLVPFLAVDLGVPDLREKLVESVHRYLGFQRAGGADAGALDPDLLRPALVAAVQDGDEKFVSFLIERFHSSLDARFRQDVMAAVAFVTDPADRDAVREFALGADVRLNELVTWLAWLLNPDARDANWVWVQQNVDRILRIGGERIGRDAPYTFGRWLCSEEEAGELKFLFDDYIDAYPGSERNLARALESISLCVAFRERHTADADAFFARAGSSESTPAD